MSNVYTVSEKIKKTEDKVDSQFKKNKEILTKKFKVLYDRTGLEWTDSDQEEIELFLDSLLLKAKVDAYIMAADLIYSVLSDDEILKILKSE